MRRRALHPLVPDRLLAVGSPEDAMAIERSARALHCQALVVLCCRARTAAATERLVVGFLLVEEGLGGREVLGDFVYWQVYGNRARAEAAWSRLLVAQVNLDRIIFLERQVVWGDSGLSW